MSKTFSEIQSEIADNQDALKRYPCRAAGGEGLLVRALAELQGEN